MPSVSALRTTELKPTTGMIRSAKATGHDVSVKRDFTPAGKTA